MTQLKYYRPQILDRIRLDRHGLIEASAGTGKTFAIQNLVLEMLLTTGATIDQILAVTFTEKATSELRARIRSTLESAISGVVPDQTPESELRTLDDDAVRKLENALFAFDRAPIYTIHGFCHRTLSDFAFPSGMRFGIEITDKQIAFHESFRAELRGQFGRDKKAVGLVRDWLGADQSMEELEQLLSQAGRKRYLDSDDYRSHQSMSAPQRKTLALEARVVDKLLPCVADRMNRMKRERGVLDYDDMLEWLSRALEGQAGDELAAQIRKRYRHALIDEFQDTDDSQWKIFRRVFVEARSGGNFLHIIGDPKQAIYAFRGADVHTYLNARKQLAKSGVTPVPLVENFRSTEKLIAAVNMILAQDAQLPFFDGEIRYDFPVTCGRTSLRAVNADDTALTPITLMRLKAGRKVSADAARTTVADHIAKTIGKMLTAGGEVRVGGKDEPLRPVRARDIYVLTRTNGESRTVGEFLRAANVPFAFYKQEGLFQTREAGDIADALKGVLEPGVQSRRLKTWATPFFAVPYSELPKAVELPPSHPLLERLYEWRTLADKEQFAELFNAMLHSSGLVDRELLLSNSERELTNYLHIFEILLHKAVTQRLALGEIIGLLEEYILDRALPDGEDSDVQRLESERDAVQIMTVHKSKGLEADVVFLFGGSHGGSQREQVVVFHEGGQRRIAIGKQARDEAKEELQREDREENQRLMYVAITRARAKLYLPYFPDTSTKAKPSGCYVHINNQLKRIETQLQSTHPATDLFDIVDIAEAGDGGATAPANLQAALAKWKPPAELLDESRDRDAADAFAALSARHLALTISSYTQLQARLNNSAGGDYAPEDFKTTVNAIDARGSVGDLPGGRNVGIFLHEAIETLDFKSFAESPDFGSWSARGDVRELFAAAMRRHGVGDERWFGRGREMVFNALTSRLSLGSVELAEGLHRLPFVREMEFDYPIPEETHPLLSRASSDGAWTAHSGYVKGFIDFVFSHQGKTYFADWKSDLLPSYQPGPIEQHVKLHYELQAQIYAIGVIRLLGIRTESEYNVRFGGLVYLFLRGLSATDSKAGIYFIRPSWPEIAEYEAGLIRREASTRSSQ